jgi:hypothetical protein
MTIFFLAAIVLWIVLKEIRPNDGLEETETS